MIELYDIVDAASTYLVEGTLVLHKSMKVHPKFKAYKIFSYDLYYVKDSTKSILLSFTKTENAPNDEIDRVWKECNYLFLRDLIKWFAEEEYAKLIGNGI